MGRSFSQARKKTPSSSMPIPVQRLMLTPWALSMADCESVMPTIVTMTP
ncbi:hypothetical protein H4K36_16295 [Streptomyces sp. DHE7-1]|nr:hypothetical protein [Streptomyces sp. DHE7-1]